MSAVTEPTTASIRATIEHVTLDVLSSKFSESAAQHVLLELLPTAEDVVLRSALRYDFADQCWLSLPTSLMLAMHEALPDLPWAHVAIPRVCKAKPAEDAEEEEQEAERDEEEEEGDATEAETEVTDAGAAHEEPVAGGGSASSRRLMEKAGPANDALVRFWLLPDVPSPLTTGSATLASAKACCVAPGTAIRWAPHATSAGACGRSARSPQGLVGWSLVDVKLPLPLPCRSTRTKEASERDTAKAAVDACRLQMLPDMPSHNPSDPSPALPPTSPASSRHTEKSADPAKKSTGKRAAPEPGDAPEPKMPHLELLPPVHPLVGSRVFDPLDASRVVGLISPIPVTPATPIDPLPAAVVERLGCDEEQLGTLEYYFNVHHAWIQQFAMVLTEIKGRIDGLQQVNESLREELRQTQEAGTRTAEQDRSVVEGYHQEFVAFRERVDAALGKPDDAGGPSSALVVPNAGAKGADPLFLPEADSDAEGDVDDSVATKKADSVNSEEKPSSSEASSSESMSEDESGADAEGAGLVRVKGKESALQAMQRREAERREEEKRAAEQWKAKGKGKAHVRQCT
ncbi:hypothetical protein OE88DRAFT_1647687 [Heliocybe sulcata]|uniref:Uncharacterized protein n=1 Tax=Heliocybe sulcata TaxID=5364 RepID=A0A5C3MRN9_9AGAM|nr:hypothetical protein OE88DRAFT_1647687 [Heliocybe sulcata]